MLRRLAAWVPCLALAGLLTGCYTAGNNSSLSAPIPEPAPAGLGLSAAGSVPGCAVGGNQIAVDLPTVLRLAGGRNLDVRVIREGMREAHARMVHAGQWLLPTVKPGVRFNKVNGDVQGTDGTVINVDKENALVGAHIVMEWEIGEGIYNALAAQRRADARRADLQAGFNDAALRAAEAYMDLLQAQGESVVADASCVLYGTFVQETTAQAKVGGGFRGDILAAKARLAHAKVLQAKAREHVQVASVRLREILDLPCHVTLVAAEPQPAPLALIDPNCDERSLIAEALAARPEIRAARGDSRAALAEHDKTTTGVLFPDVRVGYEGGLFGDGFDDLDGTSRLGVGLEWKLGRGGIGDSSRQAATASRVRRSRLRVQQVRQTVIREVTASKAALEARQTAMSHAQSGAADAAEALGLYRERQELGVGLPLEAILAEESLTRARLDQVQAIIGFNKAQLRLLRALGRR